MKVSIYRGFDGDPLHLPTREVAGAVAFREPRSFRSMRVALNLLSFLLMVLFLIPIVLRYGGVRSVFVGQAWPFLGGVLLYLCSIPLRELFHILFFRERVTICFAPRKGLLWVHGTESMTRRRFILMSILPTLVFGVLPYLLFLCLLPDRLWLGLYAVFAIGAGIGDGMNLLNAILWMPRGSLCFSSGIHTYWYMPAGAGDGGEEGREAD